jgi:hypothetical protein
MSPHESDQPPSEAVWDELPGGRWATNHSSGDTWVHLASTQRADPRVHLFMHGAHPDFGAESAFAHVAIQGGVAQLARFSIPIHNAEVTDGELDALGDYLSEAAGELGADLDL